MGHRTPDIVQSALRNDFAGVGAALNSSPSAINAQDPGNGITALIGASGRNLEGMVDFLLSQEGIDTSVVDCFGHDALEHARAFPEIVNKLVRHKYPDLKWQEPDPSL